jgi:hypothetical protein
LSTKIGAVAGNLNPAALDQKQVVLPLTFPKERLALLRVARTGQCRQFLDLGIAQVFEENDGSEDPI